MQVPETLIGTALAIALLPTLSEYFSRGEQIQFRDTINHAMRVLIALTIPVIALLWFTLPILVESLFGFNTDGIELVVWATRAYLLGLLGHSLLEMSARSFYAQQDARTPLYLAALNAIGYLIFAVLLSRWIGAVGIALANTISFSLEATFLLILLNRRYAGIFRIQKTLIRIILVSIFAALFTIFLLMLPLPPLPLTIITLAIVGLGIIPFILPELKILIKL